MGDEWVMNRVMNRVMNPRLRAYSRVIKVMNLPTTFTFYLSHTREGVR